MVEKTEELKIDTSGTRVSLAVPNLTKEHDSKDHDNNESFNTPAERIIELFKEI